MGMPKIDKRSEVAIVSLLNAWPTKKRLTWETLRVQIGLKRRQANVWSRQALSANEAISTAYATTKHSDHDGSKAPKHSRSWYAKENLRMTTEISDLKAKLAALHLQHVQLVHNVAQLPGGTSLLVLPLPSNTRNRREDT